MAYEGEHLNYCPANMFNFAQTYVVVVTGVRLNKYGHMILNTGGPNGMFFHVSDLYGLPRMMDHSQFARYLAENKKAIITVMRIDIPQPDKAEKKLEEIMGEKWAWGALVHNCETMVEDIVVAGGGRKLRLGLLPLPLLSSDNCQTWPGQTPAELNMSGATR